jgi:poly(A) polymerase
MIDLSKQPWFLDQNNQRIMSILCEDGVDSRYVGGCVRDAILGLDILDIDIATPLLPETVIRRMEDEGIKVIPTGIDHGTVTAVLEGQTYEITTLRADVDTDGRHAEVRFSTSWDEDCRRRDFTFNAISLDQKGHIFDPFDGASDLKNGFVRFIGKPEKRITEDYLRILRFFRFFARFGKGPMDQEGVKACVAHKEGLQSLSGERISHEVFGLLKAKGCAKAMKEIKRIGLLDDIFSNAEPIDALELLCAFEEQPDSLRRMALLIDAASINDVAKRLRLSKKQAKRLSLARSLNAHLDPQKGEGHLKAFIYKFGAMAARDQLMIYWAEKGFSGLGAVERQMLKLIDQLEQSPLILPIGAKDLMDRGISAGPQLGEKLKALENKWLETGCEISRDDLLALDLID